MYIYIYIYIYILHTSIYVVEFFGSQLSPGIPKMDLEIREPFAHSVKNSEIMEVAAMTMENCYFQICFLCTKHNKRWKHKPVKIHVLS